MKISYSVILFIFLFSEISGQEISVQKSKNNSIPRMMIGINNSFFAKEKSSNSFGVLLGINYERKVFNDVSICSGLTVSNRGGRLKNKKILGYPGNIYSYDINCLDIYLEIPMNLKYSLSTVTNKYLNRLYFRTGAVFALPILNYSRLEYRKILKEYDSPSDLKNNFTDYDYSFIEDPDPFFTYLLENFNVGYNVSVGFRIKSMVFELTYLNTFLNYLIYKKENTYGYVHFREEIHSIYLLVSIPLRKAG